MLDRRYPHFCRLSDAPIDAQVKSRARRLGDSVARRTGTNYVFNKESGGLYFFYGPDPVAGPVEVPIAPQWWDTRKPCREDDADAIVRYINLGKMPAREKDRQLFRAEEAEKQEKSRQKSAMVHDRAHDIESYATHLDRKRRGVETKVVTL